MLPHMVAANPTFPQCAAYPLVASMPHNYSISFGALIVNVHVQLARYANIDQNNLLFLRYQIINTQQSWTDLWCDHFPYSITDQPFQAYILFIFGCSYFPSTAQFLQKTLNVS